MINVVNATTLAVTKLRTRKVRTAVTIVTASLLFSSLVMAVTIADGFLKSAGEFTSKGLADRYIVSVMDFETSRPDDTPELRASAERIYAKTVADKKAEAKRLGIDYDSSSEPKPVTGTGNEAYLDFSAPAVVTAVAEQQTAEQTPLGGAKKLAAKYHPMAFYDYAQSVNPGMFREMLDGKEDFANLRVPGVDYNQQDNLVNGWKYLDQSITQPFLLPEKAREMQKDSNAIPIIAPYNKVEKALGLEPLPRSATPSEQLAHIQQVRDKAATVTFDICYRNTVSYAQIEQAISTAKEVEKNKGNKDYQRPALMYGTPDPADCAPATVLSDTRSATEKQFVAKQQQFDKTFGAEVDPVQQKVTFRVVGLSPSMFGYQQDFSTMNALVSMVAGSSLQGNWVVPQQLFDALPDKAQYDQFTSSSYSYSSTKFLPPTPLVEFATAADAKAFVDNEGCNGGSCMNKPYVAYFGSNSMLISDIAAGTTKVLRIAGMIIGGIAALVLMGMVGRVIADSRRETAVFRAIGAKRSDIRIIYAIYTILLSLWIGVSSLALGLLGAWWIDSKWSGAATVQAQLNFMGVDSTQQFHLFGIWWAALALIVALIIAAGLISMLLPLSRNLARNPIKDMRDE